MKTLNTEQIEILFQFCQKHSVRYYDVQVELVDHLASSIETKMETNPNISFDDALKEEYKNFGITGFGRYLSDKETQVKKQLARERRKMFLDFLTPPQFFLVLLFLMCLLYPFSTKNIEAMRTLCYIIAPATFTISFGSVVYLWTEKRKRLKKVFILDDSKAIYLYSYVSISVQANLQLYTYATKLTNTHLKVYYGSILIIINILIILVIIVSIKQYKKLKQYVIENYPNVFEANDIHKHI
ncbi:MULTISPECIES: hypothetical protein [Chitinophagaceae]